MCETLNKIKYDLQTASSNQALAPQLQQTMADAIEQISILENLTIAYQGLLQKNGLLGERGKKKSKPEPLPKFDHFHVNFQIPLAFGGQEGCSQPISSTDEALRILKIVYQNGLECCLTGVTNSGEAIVMNYDQAMELAA